MPADKRPREGDDVADAADALDARRKVRKVRADLLGVVRGGDIAAGIAHCRGLASDAERAAALMVLAAVVPHDGVGAVCDYVREVVEAKAAGAWAGEEILGLGATISTLGERLRGCDVAAKGKLLCLLVRFPVQEFLLQVRGACGVAGAEEPLASCGGGVVPDTPTVLGTPLTGLADAATDAFPASHATDADAPAGELRASVAIAPPASPLFDTLAALPVGELRGRLGDFAECVRGLANQSEGGISNYPNFADALAKVTDVNTKRPDDTDGTSAPAARVMMNIASGSVARSGPFGNTLSQTEVLLRALVKAHAVVREAAERGKGANPALTSALQSIVLGLTNLLGGAEGAGYAAGEEMREAAWAAWRGRGYAPLVDGATTTTDASSNDVTLARKHKHPVGVAVPVPTGFLAADTEPPAQKPVTAEDFLGVAAMHLHPDAGMEAEYLITRNFLYVWRATRFLMAGKDFRFTPDVWCADSAHLEATVPKLYPDLGQKVLDAFT